MRSIDPRLLNMMLLGFGDSTRRLLELPVLADVWAALARNPGGKHPLLLTSTYDTDAGDLALQLTERATDIEEIAAIQGFVAGCFDLDHVLTTLLPLTHWWSKFLQADDDDEDESIEPFEEVTREVIFETLERMRSFENGRPHHTSEPHLHYRARQLVGLALVAGTLEALRHLPEEPDRPPIGSFNELNAAVPFETIAGIGKEQVERLRWAPASKPAMIWIVTTNRRVEFATLDSVKTVKGDAARQLFDVDCSKITWAILDSGIDANHPAFEGKNGKSRVVDTYDFGQITRILDQRNASDKEFRRKTAALLRNHHLPEAERIELVQRASSTYRNDPANADWLAIEKLVRRENPQAPLDPHGTHVAGILAGSWKTRRRDGKERWKVLGVCPDIKLVDIRVLGEDREQTEFAVICALQFVRYLNGQAMKRQIDGVNLSLSIHHDVLSYACGKTPVCLEAEKLVARKTVVVAAAGNNGYQSYRLATGKIYNGYAVASITDPGNAENVITVGATHRYAPHTYGVSYFSSRGPTGDGRAKPDILAPGERITSAVPGRATDTMDGTSMAAPHVSGAAAILMARHRELRGEPAAIKRILCSSTTDVGRIADFQGHGLLDILRALQNDWRTAL